MSVRKPCDDDLYEIANFLEDVHPDSVIYPAAKRVARWLEQSSRVNTLHLPVNEVPPGPGWEIETGNNRTNKWVRA